ncbi:sigma-70, region 4 family protein [Carnobacterium maltaromaticum LMA28]|uniref:Sigma-70, region 4 family protein n=1 Tax=Carnobacterium maltaromaticum LMA28 TaxID=1234679 RepID=K8ERX3_CARML|nr:sigma factor-like helix-turn-helix DNA-binding protein [Carnobacterium maltaromaticum]CCO11306.2 sigma-70, region 4 family protein [Carnobacterium maltaromaticum LMA28]
MKYADELINEYTTDLKPIKALYSYYRDHRNICLILFKECEEAQEWELSVEFRNDYQYYKARAKELGSIISSSEYSIQWLRDAKEPGNRREIGRRSRYQRTELWGEIEGVALKNYRDSDLETLTDQDKKVIKEILSCLSPKEYEAYVSIFGKGNSYKTTAEYLGLSRGNIQTLISRSLKKIDICVTKGVNTNLF